MTTTDLAETTNADGLDVVPSAPAVRSTSSIRLAQQVEDMKLAAQYARGMCYTTAVPDIYRVGSKQNKDRSDEEVIGNAAAAIIYGGALGIDAPQSLQNIFSVGGKPAIYARTAVALLTRQGYKISTKHKSDDLVTVVGVAPDGRSEESTWTIERATKAGYVPTIDEKTGDYRKNQWGKMIGNEKYLTDPITMLKSKAQMEVCRDLAPDVLMGFAADDLDTAADDDDRAPRRVRNESSTPAVNAVDELKARLALPQESTPTPPVKADTANFAEPESPEPETKKPTAAQVTKLNALLTRAGLTAKEKVGRQIVVASFFPGRESAAAPSADDIAHVIAQLEQIADSGEDDSVLVAFAEDVITQHAQAEQEG